jgi:hypothetical protein
MFARKRTGDVKKSPFRFIDVVQFSFVSRISDALD